MLSKAVKRFQQKCEEMLNQSLNEVKLSSTSLTTVSVNVEVVLKPFDRAFESVHIELTLLQIRLHSSVGRACW